MKEGSSPPISEIGIKSPISVEGLKLASLWLTELESLREKLSIITTLYLKRTSEGYVDEFIHVKSIKKGFIFILLTVLEILSYKERTLLSIWF